MTTCLTGINLNRIIRKLCYIMNYVIGFTMNIYQCNFIVLGIILYLLKAEENHNASTVTFNTSAF